MNSYEGAVPCADNPDGWATHRLGPDLRYRRVPLAAIAAAQATCRTSCPAFGWCSTLIPTPGTVQAGEVYDNLGRPYSTLDAFAGAEPELDCGAEAGTSAGYYRHLQAQTPPCQPCQDARNATKRTAAERSGLCWSRKHPRNPENIILNAAGAAVCLRCREEVAAANKAKAAQLRAAKARRAAA